MQRTSLFWPVLAIAAFAALIVAISPFTPAVSASIVQSWIYVVGGVSALVFIRMVIDPKCRRGVQAASIEYQRLRKSWWSMGPGFLDPQWGIFGSRAGPPALLWVRAILIAELIIAAVFGHRLNTGVAALAFAGFMLTTALGLVHVGLNTSPIES